MSSRRTQRVSELVKQVVSEIVQQMALTDCGFVTVTAARVSADLKEGRIYYSVIGSAEQQARAAEVLAEQQSYIQHELSRRIVLKYTPRLQFVLDETGMRAARIEHLLDELSEDTKPPPPS